MTQDVLWSHLKLLADLACEEFELELLSLKPFRPEEEEKDCLGRCYEDHTVKMRVHCYRQPGRPLAWSTIADTLAHELAHLKDWHAGDCKEHSRFRREILKFWKEKGLI